MAQFITFQPSDFFSPKIYAGSASAVTVTGLDFQPDMTWTKDRQNTGYHALIDSANGVGKYTQPDNASVQSEVANNCITSFTSDGFVTGTAAPSNNSSSSGIGFMSWNWKAGTTTGIATNGSTTITPSAYSFSQTAGLSILSYTGNATAGAKLAHGLGKAPTLIWVKNLDDGNDWKVYQKHVKATDPEDWVMILNTGAATTDDNTVWNDTQPDDVNITLGSSTHVNDSSTAYAAYCFAPIQGKQIFGRYYGNANANGPFIQTNFRPKFVVLKRLDGTTDWTMLYNPPYTENDASIPALWVNSTSGEGSYATIDFLSNGFKIKDTSAVINTNGGQHVYWAFAEFPFVSSNSKPGTAR